MSTVLITGSSGFLGNTISRYFTNDKVLRLNSKTGDIVADLKQDVPKVGNLDIVIHSAGKAHSIPKTKGEIKEFYDVNVVGTQNLLKGLEHNPTLKYFVFISSVAVYGLQNGLMIDENAPLLAQDPYGDSKIKAETAVKEWCEKNNIIYTILRLPLLAGPNPPGNLKSMIKAVEAGYYVNIAGGKAKKSIVMAEDVAKIIPAAMRIGGVYNLTDRHHPSFLELSDLIASQLNKKKSHNIPKWLASSFAVAGNLLGKKAPINSNKLSKMVSDLTFNDDKAVASFDWNPTPVLTGFRIK